MPRMLFSFIPEQHSLDPCNFSFKISFPPPFLSPFIVSSLALPSQLLSGATALKLQLRAYFIGTRNSSTFLWFLWLLLFFFFLARESHTLARKKCKLWGLQAEVLDSRPRQALRAFWTLISPPVQWGWRTEQSWRPRLALMDGDLSLVVSFKCRPHSWGFWDVVLPFLTPYLDRLVF